jgi:putative transposase
VIRDEADMENHVHYIHYNPVKHGLARCPGDWQYSSFARFVAGGEYEPDWGCADRATPSFRVPELRWECE